MNKPKFIITIMLAIAGIAMFSCKDDKAVPVISITEQPAANTAVTAGSITGSLTVAATVTEGATLSYQWYKSESPTTTTMGGAAESGATSASFTIPATLAAGEHYYFCEVSATGGAKPVRSNTATVAVTAAVVKSVTIAAQVGTLFVRGGSATYQVTTVSIANTATHTTSWFSNATGTTSVGAPAGVSVALPTGSSQRIMTVTTTAATPAGTYYFGLTLEGAQSNVATLTVTAPNGSSGNPYLVANAADLQKIGTGVDGWTLSRAYRQTANITLSGDWTPKGTDAAPFSGWYDGGGFFIANLRIAGGGSVAFQGLFGVIADNGVVRNVALRDASGGAAGVSYVGGIAGRNRGLIENCYVAGTSAGLVGTQFVGGIAGENTGGTIKNCYSACSVMSNQGNVGGIAGANTGTIELCYATKTIQSAAPPIGGVVGSNSGSVRRCVALFTNIIASIFGNDYGRVAGVNTGTLDYNYSRISNCFIGGSYRTALFTGASGKDGTEVATTNFNGSSSSSWWSGTATFSHDLWNIANGRLPHLRTKTGGAFSATQTPAVE